MGVAAHFKGPADAKIGRLNQVRDEATAKGWIENEYALKAALSVPTLADQKLIKKKEVSPIISQPKNKLIKFPDETKKTILIINIFKNKTNLSTKGSYLK